MDEYTITSDGIHVYRVNEDHVKLILENGNYHLNKPTIACCCRLTYPTKFNLHPVVQGSYIVVLNANIMDKWFTRIAEQAILDHEIAHVLLGHLKRQEDVFKTAPSLTVAKRLIGEGHLEREYEADAFSHSRNGNMIETLHQLINYVKATYTGLEKYDTLKDLKNRLDHLSMTINNVR